jgi:hypothetical protein
MVPSPPTGPVMVAPAAVPPATNARAAAPVMTVLRMFMLASRGRRIRRALRAPVPCRWKCPAD